MAVIGSGISARTKYDSPANLRDISIEEPEVSREL